jgi:DtxR family Mn-dependent transcriptional regulator
MELSNSREDYLEAIYQICEQKKVARVKNIASRLNVSIGSVTYAINALLDSGLIKHKKYGYIELTEKGREIGKKILEKHKLIKNFLINILKVDEKIAEEDACKIEHCISNQTYERIESFLRLHNVKGIKDEFN